MIIIAGPCVIESQELCLEIAKELSLIDRSIIFKASYDKANRSGIKSYRGVGFEKGMEILTNVYIRTDLRVTSDIHTVREASKAARYLDVIQIPAMLCRQTDIIAAAGAKEIVVNLKKGQFMDAKRMAQAVEKVGHKNVMITERGNSFGYNDVVIDMRNIQMIKDICEVPVIIDASHPAGDRSMIPVLAKAGIAAGADGVFIEVHPNPDKAKCDGATSLELSKLGRLIRELKSIYTLVQIGEKYD